MASRYCRLPYGLFNSMRRQTGKQSDNQPVDRPERLGAACAFPSLRPLKILMVVVWAGNGRKWQALVSTAKRRERGLVGLESQESAGNAFQVDNCSLASGQLLARIWPFRVIMIG